MLSHLLYLVYLNPKCQIFINLDASKEFEFGVIIYHLKRNLTKKEYFARKVVEPILFLNQLLHPTETCYWPIKLELVSITEILQKILYMMKLSKHQILIFTDLGIALGIAKEILLLISSTNKLNLRLI